jgi:WYL domain
MTKIIPFPSSAHQTLDTQLRFAIANRRLLRFTYDGAARVAEPHDYGVRGGEERLLAYQRDKAGRTSPDVRGWRSLVTSKIHDCVVLEETFAGSRQAPDQQHHQWDVLYARVEDEP